MNFIKAEEFLKQSEKVQKVLIKWWKPQIGDLYYDDSHEELDMTRVINLRTNHNLDGDLKYLSNKVTPLLQLHQLIYFIEDKGYFIEFDNFNKKYCFAVYKSLNQTNATFASTNKEQLEALWQVAIEIATTTL